MNDLDLCLEVVSRSCQPSSYIRCWISRKPLEIDAWLQRTTNRKWHIGYQMVTWPQRCCKAVRSAILVTAWLLVCLLIVRCSQIIHQLVDAVFRARVKARGRAKHQSRVKWRRWWVKWTALTSGRLTLSNSRRSMSSLAVEVWESLPTCLFHLLFIGSIFIARADDFKITIVMPSLIQLCKT